MAMVELLHIHSPKLETTVAVTQLLIAVVTRALVATFTMLATASIAVLLSVGSICVSRHDM